MENSYTQAVKEKSHEELLQILRNQERFQLELCLAAIEELETRDLADDEVSGLREQIRTRKQKEENMDRAESAATNRWKDTFQLLIPSKEHRYTPIIIYLNVLVFILMVLSGVSAIEPSVEDLLHWGGNLRSATYEGDYWRLLSSVFVHGGIIHLLLNMYALLEIGVLLERQFGKNRFLFVYLASGLFASITSAAINENVVSVGASGAVFGVYGLTLALLFMRRMTLPEESRKELLGSVLFFAGYNLFYGLTKEGIDNAAHIGGLVSGFGIGYCFYPVFKKPQRELRVYAGVSALVCGAFLITLALVPNSVGNWQKTMEQFGENEKNAMWMYEAPMNIDEANRKNTAERIRKEGTDLWEANIRLLDDENELPEEMQEVVVLLKKYSEQRKRSCELMEEHVLRGEDPFQQGGEIEKVHIELTRTLEELEALQTAE